MSEESFLPEPDDGFVARSVGIGSDAGENTRMNRHRSKGLPAEVSYRAESLSMALTAEP